MDKKDRLLKVIQELTENLNPIVKSMITPYLATTLQNNDSFDIDMFIDGVQSKIDYIKSGDIVGIDND